MTDLRKMTLRELIDRLQAAYEDGIGADALLGELASRAPMIEAVVAVGEAALGSVFVYEGDTAFLEAIAPYRKAKEQADA